jgi:hypothetical protein
MSNVRSLPTLWAVKMLLSKSLSRLLASLALFTSIVCPAEDEASISIDPSVARVVEGLADWSPTKPILRTSFQSTITPVGAINAAEARYEQIGKNVWGIYTIFRNKSGAIESRSESLCGLVELLSSSSATFQVEAPVPIQLGRIFTSIGMRLNKTLNSTSKVTRLVRAEDSANLCKPEAGQAFSYEVHTATELPIPANLRSSPKTLSSSISWKCVAAQPAPGRGIVGSLTGEYIPVTCTGFNSGTGKSSVTKYAFLVDSAFYLRLETVAESIQSRNEFSAVELQQK